MQTLNNTIVVPAQIFENASYWFELEIEIIDDDMLEMNEAFTVSLDLLTQVGVSDTSVLNVIIAILDNDGMCIIIIKIMMASLGNLAVLAS